MRGEDRCADPRHAAVPIVERDEDRARRQRRPAGGGLAPVVERDRVAAFANDPAVRVERRGADVQVLERHRAGRQVVGAQPVIAEDGDARKRRARQRPPVLAHRQHAVLDGGGEGVLSRHTERGSRARPRAWCAAAEDARASDRSSLPDGVATSIERGGEPVDVARRNEPGVDAVLEHFGDAADRCGNDRHAGGHRLETGGRTALEAPRRTTQHVVAARSRRESTTVTRLRPASRAHRPTRRAAMAAFVSRSAWRLGGPAKLDAHAGHHAARAGWRRPGRARP